MAKFFVNELMEDNYDDNIQNRLGYYFVAYRDSNNKEVNDTNDVVDELGIPMEDYIKICKSNGAICLEDCIEDYSDIFITPYSAQVALQELLEYSIKFHKNHCGCECNCECEEDSGVDIPTFPESFESMHTYNCGDLDNKTINDLIESCIKHLEEDLDDDVIDISMKNTTVIVSRNYMGEENDVEDCNGCDAYYYNIKVCKDYFEYETNKDFCNKCEDEEDSLFFKE
jgi:hypothetical protein